MMYKEEKTIEDTKTKGAWAITVRSWGMEIPRQPGQAIQTEQGEHTLSEESRRVKSDAFPRHKHTDSTIMMED